MNIKLNLMFENIIKKMKINQVVIDFLISPEKSSVILIFSNLE